MLSLNKVMLIGNLGKEPEVRYTQNGEPVVTIIIATSEKWKDKQSGEAQEKTEWHRVVFFGRIAEIVGGYLKKGSKVYIEGSIKTRKWKDNDGVERFMTEINGKEMKMLGSKNEGISYDECDDDMFSAAAKKSVASVVDNFDDDIPF